MTAKELRKAATDTLEFCKEFDEMFQSMPDELKFKKSNASNENRRLLADYILANVQEDGEEKAETNVEQLCSECKIKRVSECSNTH